ncbi:hypothetical protein C0991_002397, partial [Blastosporella zonata]
LAGLEAVLDAGGIDAEGDEEEEDEEAKMAGRAGGDGEEREAGREGQEEVAERAESEGRAEVPGGFRVLPRRTGSGLGRIAQRKRERMAAKRAAKGKMRRE